MLGPLLSPAPSPTVNHYWIKHGVFSEHHGLRLDQFLKNYYRRRSREQIKKSIEAGYISIQRTQSPHLSLGRAKPSSQLILGDSVLIRIERKPEPSVNFNYEILFEDEALFVINKPPNLPVHPAGRYYFNTLLVHLRTEGHRAPLNADQDYFLAHRIDKETSGVLVLAKTKEICANLAKQFASREVVKRYIAIVHGVCPEAFQVDLPLKRATESRIHLKMVSAPESEGGMPSFTHFKRIKTAGQFSLVECFPKTGRQHQIRVHLESAGHPIVGDKLYSIPENEAIRFFDRDTLTPESEAKLLLPWHALHAEGIQFKHPVTQKHLEFTAPLPADFSNFLREQSNTPKRASQENKPDDALLKIRSQSC